MIKSNGQQPVQAVLEGRRAPIELAHAEEADSRPSGHAAAHVLAEIRFGTAPSAGTRRDHPHLVVQVPLTQLGSSPVKEFWLSSSSVERFRHADIRCAANDAVLFGYLRFELPLGGALMEEQIRSHYVSMLGLLQAREYPYLFRVWNYLPHIGDEIEGMECYQRFCRARFSAFETFYDDIVPYLPAASVMGSHEPDFHMVFAASRASPRHYENPRQVSAYRYPKRYGPKSPLFARATLVGWPNRAFLFISGTASILGHRSQHPGDVRTQAEEVIRNIEALLEHISGERGIPAQSLDRIKHLRVYVRDARGLDPVRKIVEGRMSAGTQVMYVQADICRPELLVEMEALLEMPKPL